MAGIEGLLILLAIGFVAFIVSVLFESVLLWAASKILKLKKHEFRTAFSVALFWNVVTVVLVAICLVPLLIPPLVGRGLIILLLFLIACLVNIILRISLIKRFYEEGWKNAILAFILVLVMELVLLVLLALPLMIFGTALWQLGIFNAGSTAVVTTDFSKLQPLSPTIVYSATDQKFSASFVNTVGTSISIDNVSVTESITGTSCTPQNSPSGTKIGAGDIFRIDAYCPHADKNKGDTYDMAISVQYSSVTGGLRTNHTEKGSIRGPVE